MKKILNAVAVASVGIVISGCAFNPESMPLTDRDSAVYVDPGAAKSLNVKENKAKVAVSTSVGVYKQYQLVAESLDSTLNARLSPLAFFEMVDRKSQAALISEMAGTSDDPTSINVKNVPADFLVTGRIASLGISEQQVLGSQGTMLKVDIQFDFKWISIGEDNARVIMTESIKPVVKNARNQNELPAILARAAENAAREFCTKIAAKYAPPARVLQTRGGGEAARISIGKNYGLTDDVEVMFFEIIDNSSLGGEKRDQNDVGRGIVKLVEEKTAWVQVDNFEKVNVRKGTYVRVLEQKKSFGSNFMEQTGVNEMLGK